MAIIPGLENINMAPYLGQIMYWIGWGLLGVIILAIMITFFNVSQYRITAWVYPLYGGGKDGNFSIGKRKKTRVRWINNRSAWKSLHPLFNKKEREPFDSQYIYPGNEIYAFENNDEWLPGKIEIKQDNEKKAVSITPVPYYIRNWQSLTHKKNAQEFAKQGFWEDNKHMFFILGMGLLCCVMVIATVYLTYKFSAGGRENIQMLTQAIQGLGSIGGQTINIPQ